MIDDAFEQFERDLGLPVPPKPFELVTFDQLGREPLPPPQPHSRTVYLTSAGSYTVMEWDGDAPGIGETTVYGVDDLLATLKRGSRYDHLAIDDGSAIALCEEIVELKERLHWCLKHAGHILVNVKLSDEEKRAIEERCKQVSQ